VTSILEVTGLRAGYGGADVLRDVNLTVQAGQIVALVGANGAGKTTMMHVLAGAHRASAGQIIAAGIVVGEQSQASLVRAGVVLVPEGRHVFGPMSVDDNLLLGAYVRRSHQTRQDMEWVLDLFPRLRERLTQAAGTLSGGEQQMLAIGRALMAKPKLLLLDEPTLGLAPLMVDVIASALEKLNNEGLSILIVEQNAVVALGLADYGYLMESGAITASGRPAELASDERVRAAYLGGTIVAQREAGHAVPP
jgi:branched-chain amino acid transport system ATP-binding protein